MRCATCDAVLDAAARFCGECGQPVRVAAAAPPPVVAGSQPDRERTRPVGVVELPPPGATVTPQRCPTCGNGMDADDRFCGVCGHRVTGATTTIPHTSISAAPPTPPLAPPVTPPTVEVPAGPPPVDGTARLPRPPAPVARRRRGGCLGCLLVSATLLVAVVGTVYVVREYGLAWAPPALAARVEDLTRLMREASPALTAEVETLTRAGTQATPASRATAPARAAETIQAPAPAIWEAPARATVQPQPAAAATATIAAAPPAWPSLRPPATATPPPAPAPSTVVVTVRPPASPTPTPPARATATPAAAAAFADDFNSPERGRLSKESAQPQNYRVGYENGEYLIKIINPNWDRIAVAYVPGTFGSATIGVDARLVGETAQRYIAVACRAKLESQSSEYRLAVDPTSGAFTLGRWDAGRETRLTAWTASPAIRRGTQTNRLVLRCGGNQITASINGTQVVSVQDSTYAAGSPWIGTGAFAGTPATAEARFDNLVVTQER